MIHNLKPYPLYKDSGVPWLGQVPEHWEIRSLGSLTTTRSTRNRTDLPLLSVVREKGVIPRSSMKVDENHNFIPDDLSNYKVVHEGDLVINKMKAWQGSLGVSSYNGIVSPAYYVFEFQLGDAKYGHMLLRSKIYVNFFGQVSDGVRIGQWDLSIDGMKRIPVLIPSLLEQSAIVRYLDYMDRRIRHYIHAKQKLIKLLEEQKQAIIHRAVTRGLDPNVKLKPSGVEWLGDVPEHWELSALRRHCEVIDCKHLTVPFVDEGIPLASVRQVQGFDLDLSTSNRTTEEWYSHLINGGRLPKHGDIIYCRNVSVGACSFVKGDDIFAMGQDVCLIRSETGNGRFMNYFLHSPSMKQELSLVLVGSTFKRINISQIKSLLIIMPPRNEQDEIVFALDSSLSKLDKPIELAQQEIAFIREYRTRLITDVVTGKLDVREAAASLPDELEEPEVLDDEVGDGEGLDDEQATEFEEEDGA